MSTGTEVERTLTRTNEGDRIRQRRVALGLTVKRLAGLAGVDRGRLAAIEEGASARSSTLGAIDAALTSLEHNGIDARLSRMGVSFRQFHEETGIDRKTLRRAIGGDENVRPSTYAAIESGLDRLEHEAGIDAPTPTGEGLVTFRLSSRSGVDVVVQGPVTSMAELEASVSRLIQCMGTS